jgi:4-amino-4-deoxy-L-arabinose transferase-like glycosyltransferase
VLLALGVAGAGVIAYATRWGPWVFSDSIEYLLSAESLASGGGLGFRAASGEFMPLVLHPPLYPVLLAALSPLFLEMLDGARALNIALFGLTVFITGFLLLRRTGSVVVAVSTSLLILTSPLLVYLFSGAMSESLSFFFGTAGLLLTASFIEKRRQRDLWAAAAAFGGASLARYPAVIYCLAGMASILLLSPGPLLRRVKDAFILSALGILPLALWLFASQGEFGALAQRGGGPDLRSAWESSQAARGAMVDTVWGWLPIRLIVPSLAYRGRLLLLGALAFFILGTNWWAGTRERGRRPGKERFPPGLLTVAVFGIFAIGYVAFLSIGHVLGMVMFRDIDERILSPLQPTLIVLLWCSLGLISDRSAGRRWIEALSLLAAVAFAAANLGPMLDIATKLNRDGLGYSSPVWRGSPTIAAIEELPIGMIIVSDESEAVQFLTGRGALEINELQTSEPLTVFASFGADSSDEPQRLFREGRAALVLFRSAYWQFHAIYGDRAQDRLQAFTSGLRVFRDLPDGTIYLPPEEG